MGNNIFITGASGFVGLNIARRLLEREDTVLYLLTRDYENVSAENRMAELIKSCYSEEQYRRLTGQFKIVSGDITKEGFGLESDLWNELSFKIDTIYHSAASILFNMPLEEARKINTNGTANVLEFARACYNNKVLRRMNHISTAYIAGREYANTYEITKYEAESLANRHIKEGMPIIIFRPSVITGDFLTGEIAKGNLLFDLIRQLSLSNFKDFICNDDSSLNIVPVNYLIDAIEYISAMDINIGGVFNIINPINTNIREIVESCCQILNVGAPLFIPLDKKHSASKLTRLRLYTFINYIEKSHVFDNALTDKALEGTNISCPIPDFEYWSRTISYCKKNNLF